MPLRTKLTERLGIEHPIVLAPMGAVSGGALAGAVSSAGGLGLIGLGYGDPEWLEHEFAAAGNARIGCGFITWSLARRPELLTRALAHKPLAVMLSFGDARPFIGPIKAEGALVICQVQSLAMATECIGAGADILVAQGGEAGGHGMSRGTMALVPAVADAIARSGRDIPLLAAGGIADGRGLAAALALGADGALIGTRFYASQEALASPEAKARLVRASGDATVRTSVFDIVRELDWPSQFTGRALRNDFSERWHGQEQALTANLPEAASRYGDAIAKQDLDTTVIFAGEAADLIADVRPARQIVESIVEEARQTMSRMAATVG